MKIYFALISLFLLSTPLSAQLSQDAMPLSDMGLVKTFLLQHMVYPDFIADEKINEQVSLQLSISENGTIQAIDVVQGIRPEANKEAIRLAKQIIWLPARKNGRAVSGFATLKVPFNFRELKKRNRAELAKAPKSFEKPESESEKIFTFADLNQAPYPILNQKKMTLSQYIYQHLNYPAQAFSSSISGTVSLKFVVEKNGLPSNILINEAVGAGCDQEAIRLLHSIAWMPGLKNDSIVRTWNTLNIQFKLGDKRQQAIPNNQGTNF
ncbi:MAG: TonB family protein [Bacteroidetes bacterium]|jgi:TonB family protein|nr:TonB family protein [Bacteroidota bacterium]